MSSLDFENDIRPLIDKILTSPKNLATPLELEQQAKACHGALQRADKDQNNVLTYDEIGVLCELLGLPLSENEDIEESFTRLYGDEGKFDKDQSGTIESIEFMEWWLSRISQSPGNNKQQEILAINTFQLYDIDQSGSIDINELNNLITSLGIQLTENELNEAIIELDTDRSGKIEQVEFLNWWLNRTQSIRKGGGLIAYKLKKIINKAASIYHTDIFTVVWNSQIKLLKLFLDVEPSLINSLDTSEYGNEWSILHYAAYQNHIEIVEYLLSQPLVNVNIRNADGFTPLFYSSQRNNIQICELLINSLADITLCGYDSEYPDTPPMCPVDHMIDSPALRELFLSSDKCIPPFEQPIIGTCKLTLEGILIIDIVNYGKISHLPIQKWIISFHRGNKMILTLHFTNFHLQNYKPTQLYTNLTITCQPDMRSLEILMKSIGNIPTNERNQALAIDIRAVNAMGEGEDCSKPSYIDLTEII